MRCERRSTQRRNWLHRFPPARRKVRDGHRYARASSSISARRSARASRHGVADILRSRSGRNCACTSSQVRGPDRQTDDARGSVEQDRAAVEIGSSCSRAWDASFMTSIRLSAKLVPKRSGAYALAQLAALLRMKFAAHRGDAARPAQLVCVPTPMHNSAGGHARGLAGAGGASSTAAVMWSILLGCRHQRTREGGVVHTRQLTGAVQSIRVVPLRPRKRIQGLPFDVAGGMSALIGCVASMGFGSSMIGQRARSTWFPRGEGLVETYAAATSVSEIPGFAAHPDMARCSAHAFLDKRLRAESACRICQIIIRIAICG